MIRFYDAVIETEILGSALVFREPLLKGQVLVSISNVLQGDRQRLYACVCTDEEHQENLRLAQVKELDEEAAVKLAAEYQPERLMPHIDPVTGETENLRVPPCDLRLLLAGGQSGAIGGDLLREVVP
jgi:hypothetical protein